ncbi:hypothetical protein LNKW23_06040 [Paralimibaculum aggregatum]|uniref:Uncharacterized protein n=1 Tax=Paralimibaculum aggregatum TaxID=3036245 RepID=A0ABQ6LDG3_9RHOB|nr:hypothetical protein [Limibaculum sp. NKW23]GMG81391.1 hypothetical protein LNKW23_06040 [Limibaculum sp. NKW23]
MSGADAAQVKAWAARLEAAGPEDALAALDALAADRGMRKAELRALGERLTGRMPPAALSRDALLAELARPWQEALAAQAKAAALKSPGAI